MVERWTHVLFDMDGTLLNSGEPIMSRIARTVSHFGGSVPSDAELRLMLGPTTTEVLEKYLPPDVVEEATAFYRELAHREAMSGFSLFDGVAELLHDLNNAGIALATATSKLEEDASAVATHFGIASAFRVIAGAAPQAGIRTKAQVVARALSRLNVARDDRPLMIGDRIHDIHGAARNGVPTILCKWGYADPSEGAFAFSVSDSVKALRKQLLG